MTRIIPCVIVRVNGTQYEVFSGFGLNGATFRHIEKDVNLAYIFTSQEALLDASKSIETLGSCILLNVDINHLSSFATQE